MGPEIVPFPGLVGILPYPGLVSKDSPSPSAPAQVAQPLADVQPQADAAPQAVPKPSMASLLAPIGAQAVHIPGANVLVPQPILDPAPAAPAAPVAPAPPAPAPEEPGGAYDVFDQPLPIAVNANDNVVIHGVIDQINAVIDHRLPRQAKNAPSSKWGLYWESHRVWRDWINNRLKKKKGKALKAKTKTVGFYYENEKDWTDWLNARDIDAHYKPRILLEHQHVSHDRIHDNIDIHTGHHMLEAYVHLRATKKNIVYLAHVLKQ